MVEIQDFTTYTFQLAVREPVTSEVEVVALTPEEARDQVEATLDSLGIVAETEVTLVKRDVNTGQFY